jgi:hypothetical protein
MGPSLVKFFIKVTSTVLWCLTDVMPSAYKSFLFPLGPGHIDPTGSLYTPKSLAIVLLSDILPLWYK